MTVFKTEAIEQFKLNKANVQRNTSDGTETVYIGLIPGFHTMITINKAGSTVTLKLTSDFNDTSVDTAVFGKTESSGTTDYQKTHTAGFTGCEIDVTAYVGDVVVIVTQFLLGR